jgi:hypothetical protein
VQGDDSNVIEDSFNNGNDNNDEQYDFVAVSSKKTKEKAKDKKERLQKKARNIIGNDGYAPE